MGEYIQTINDYGIVLHMVNLCSNTYPTLFENNLIDNSIKILFII